MLEINRNSWHFRLWRWGRESYDPKPKNLCLYFWHIVIFKIVFPAALAVLVVSGFIIVLITIWNSPWVSLALILGAAVGLLLVIGAVRLRNGRLERSTLVRQGKLPPKQPSILRTFLAARKAKLCPLIRVTGEKTP